MNDIDQSQHYWIPVLAVQELGRLQNEMRVQKQILEQVLRNCSNNKL